MRLLPAVLLAACAGSGTWNHQLDSELATTGLAASLFDDGCSVVYDQFLINQTGVRALDAKGRVLGEADWSVVVDLVPDGTVTTHSVDAKGRQATEVYATVASHAAASAGPDTDPGAPDLIAQGEGGVVVSGELSCPDGSIDFAWALATDLVWRCPVDFVPDVESPGTSTVHLAADALFAQTLGQTGQALLGAAILTGDRNNNGTIDEEELGAISPSVHGYDDLGDADILTLEDFVNHQARIMATGCTAG